MSATYEDISARHHEIERDVRREGASGTATLAGLILAFIGMANGKVGYRWDIMVVSEAASLPAMALEYAAQES